MCGILAIYSQNQEPIKSKDLELGITALRHRGPEVSEIWRSASEEIGLAHSRLSIIDLNTGNQPIHSIERATSIVANGEFYEYEKIRNELTKSGHKFTTCSDSEIALHLYERYGTSGLKYLRGEFAFAIWDNVNNILFAARDRFGIKPLFYSIFNNKVYIASEIKALLAAGVPADWDTESYNSRAYIMRDRTLFNNIHQVPPGHYLLASKNSIRIHKYWDFNYLQDCENEAADEIDMIAGLQAEIKEAVKVRMRADVPVGVYLSGGIDSSAVLGIASEYTSRPIDSFSLYFEDSQYNEYDIAKATADYVNSNFNSIKISQNDLADNFQQSVCAAETICINGHGVAKYLLSKFVHEAGYKVVLTGEGADEIFAGYPPFRQDYALLNGKQDANYEKLMQTNKVSSGLLINSDRADQRKSEFVSRVLGFTPTWISAQYEMVRKLDALKIDKQRNCFLTIEQMLRYCDISNQVDGINPVHKAMYLMSKSLLPNYILTVLGDRMEMAHSIEGRTPFLDHKLVEYVVKLPIEMKINRGVEKYALREAVKPWVTKQVYNREKHPFLTPPSILNPTQSLYQLARDIFSSDISQPFYDLKAVMKFMDDALSLDVNQQIAAEPIIMEILSVCMLHAKYFK